MCFELSWIDFTERIAELELTLEDGADGVSEDSWDILEDPDDREHEHHDHPDRCDVTQDQKGSRRHDLVISVDAWQYTSSAGVLNK